MKPGPKNPIPKHGAYCGYWNRKAALNHIRKAILDQEDALCHLRRVQVRLREEHETLDRRRLKREGHRAE